MEISKDAILRVVHAERLAKEVADGLRMLMSDQSSETKADVLVDNLRDAIFLMAEGNYEHCDDILSSDAMKILEANMSDLAVTEWMIENDRIRKRVSAPEEVQQPKPQTMDPETVERCYKANGGYRYDPTPEGEWQ